MESSVGYSQGSGTKIATHQFGTGIDAIHHQRFAVGTGKAILLPLIKGITSPGTSAVRSCVGAGRIVVSALSSIVGSTLRIYFYDENFADMGSSDIIEPELSELAAFDLATPGWIGSTLYPPLKIIRIASTVHAYMQVAGSPDFIEGTSAVSEPVWPIDGGTIADGTCVWEDIGTYSSMKVTPLVVFSNSMGASYYRVAAVAVSGTLSLFSDAV